MNLIAKTPKQFYVISGDDLLALPTVLAGGSGVISAIANVFPNQIKKMVDLGFKSDVSQSYRIHYKLMKIINLIFEYTIFIPEYVYIEIKEYSKFLAIQLLQKIIIDNEFDISWYCVDTLDYQWANDTIYNCNTIINNILENIS